MKKRDIIKKLTEHGWILKRRGGNHDIYYHPDFKRPVPVKRQREIPDSEAHAIFREAGIE